MRRNTDIAPGEATRPNAAQYRALGLVAALAYATIFADGLLPQLQMLVLGGQLLVNNVVAKGFVLLCIFGGLVLRPNVSTKALPIFTWKLCVGYLLVDFLYLLASGQLQAPDIIQSYNVYYAVLLSSMATVTLRGTVSDRLLTRGALAFLAVFTLIGLAQYLMHQPLLYTESANGAFLVNSWDFDGDVRAFSLFSSGLGFGLYTSLCGALGVALFRESPARGMTVLLISAVACFTTISRTSYLVYCCACAYAIILTYGTNSRRGLWSPVLYLLLAVGTTFYGMGSYDSDTSSHIKSAASLVERIIEWTYYGDMFLQAPIQDKLFGFGMIQHEGTIDTVLVPIDNLFLALIMHIGAVGLVLFIGLMTSMWLYLRRQALVSRQPFIIASASLCAAFPCSGSFSIMFVSFGATFGLAILCREDLRDSGRSTHPAVQRVLDRITALLGNRPTNGVVDFCARR